MDPVSEFRHPIRPRAIANWLTIVAALIVLIVIVGGITRLTESGLSITEWNVVTGILPPLSEAAWLSEFEKYKQIPEYQQINKGMSLAAFQFIYFWEYIHRLLARIIGFAFAAPLVWFAWKRAIPRGYGLRLTGLLALGGLQGVIGWWMVSSGLAERTDVSHFRLAAHLLLALFILAALTWTILDLRNLARDPGYRPARLTGLGWAVALILFIQLLYGAFTAGLNAGLVTDQWPLMNGRFFPSEVLAVRSALDAAVNDPAMIHWIHRWWAWVAVAALVILARHARAAGSRAASIAIHSAFGVQILLGIATVMTGVDITLGVLHQGVGALLVIATAWGIHVIGRRDRGFR
jgi:cytochrome c oxidase assembly protein subunit 15